MGGDFCSISTLDNDMFQQDESTVRRERTKNVSGVVPNQTSRQQGPGLALGLLCWIWLPTLGALVGAGAGYWVYTKIPELYESTALIQVGYALPATTGTDPNNPNNVTTWAGPQDESRVIKSQRVLQLAVDLGELSDYFPDESKQKIVFELMDVRNGVVIEPVERPGRMEKGQWIISYTSGHPEAAQAVVEAIVTGYQAFLAEEYQTVDDQFNTVGFVSPTFNPNHKVLRVLNPASAGLLGGPFLERYILGGVAIGILLMFGFTLLLTCYAVRSKVGTSPS